MVTFPRFRDITECLAVEGPGATIVILSHSYFVVIFCDLFFVVDFLFVYDL